MIQGTQNCLQNAGILTNKKDIAISKKNNPKALTLTFHNSQISHKLGVSGGSSVMRPLLQC